MAVYPVNGSANLLYINTVLSTSTYGPDVIIPGTFDLVCDMTDNGFDATADNIDTSGKCSGVFKTGLPGQIGWSFSGTGNTQNIPTNDNDHVSQNALEILFRNQTKFWAGVWDTALKTVRYGVVYITAFSEANPVNGAATFNITLQGDGEYWNQVATT